MTSSSARGGVGVAAHCGFACAWYLLVGFGVCEMIWRGSVDVYRGCLYVPTWMWLQWHSHLSRKQDLRRTSKLMDRSEGRRESFRQVYIRSIVAATGQKYRSKTWTMTRPFVFFACSCLVTIGRELSWISHIVPYIGKNQPLAMLSRSVRRSSYLLNFGIHACCLRCFNISDMILSP